MALGKYQKLDQDSPDIDLEAARPPAYDATQNRDEFNGYGASADPIAGPSTSAAAVNFISVLHEHIKIIGSYTIDTSLAATPLQRLFPADSTEASSSSQETELTDNNALFKTEGGDIELNLHVRGGKKAVIRAEAKHGGHIWVNFPQRAPSTPLHLHIKGSSNVRVALPASFRGPVAGGSKHSGPIKFSAGLQNLGVTTFLVNQKNPLEAKYFVGQWEGWASSGDGGVENQWTGDRLVITSEHGDVIVQTYEEREAEEQAVRDRAEERRLRRQEWPQRAIPAFGKIFVALWGVVVAIAYFVAALFNLN